MRLEMGKGASMKPWALDPGELTYSCPLLPLLAMSSVPAPPCCSKGCPAEAANGWLPDRVSQPPLPASLTAVAPETDRQ